MESQKRWSVSFIKVAMKSNKKKLKGFTLIELLLIIAISNIILITIVTATLKYSKLFKQEMNAARESFNVNQGFIIIEKEITDAEEIKIENNELKLKPCKFDYWDSIRKNGSSNIIISYGSGREPANNNVLKKVKSFKLYEKQGVVYICIQMQSEKVYERCINLQWKRNIADLY